MKLNFKYYTLFIILFLSCEKDNAIATIDCQGTIGGIFIYDDCGDCKHPQDQNFNSECTDCNGDIFGDALLDNCDICDDDPSNDCVKDCEGVWGGPASIDDCGICSEGDDFEYKSVNTDGDELCDGIDFNSDGQCDICTEVGVPTNECNSSNLGLCACYGDDCDDCVDFYIDECGVCNGTGIDEDSDGICDDIDDCLPDDIVPYANNCGECNGIVDQCQICNGNGIDEDQDGLCDNLDLDNDGDNDDTCLLNVGPNGSGIIDECNICGGNGIANEACDCDGNTLDCRNVCGGDALIDDCGNCYNWVNNEGVPYLVPPMVDADSDGLCDGTDSDGDGLCDDDGNGCDGEDLCPNDSENDLDNDGICGDVDLCFGNDNSGDSDNDSICDDSDDCPHDPNNNIDGDEFCGDVDTCPNDPDNDSDNDGVCGDIDACQGFNDNIDTDSDSIPDDCDICNGFDDNIDTDSDGIADGCDNCPEDPNNNIDGDEFCGDVDTCPNDPNNDSDGDGICGDVDQCEGYDDNIDTDSDGTADGCDVCANDADDDLDDDGICGDIDTCPNDPNNDSDNDNICDDIDDCIGNNFDECGVCNGTGILDGECDCDGNVLDCNDECNGSAVLDCHNVCNGPANIDACGICSGYTELIDNVVITIHPSVDTDNDGICDGTDADGDGQCDVDNNGDCDGNDTCIGNNFDECGVCNGSGVDSDNDDICDDIDDCIGNIYDECGVCNGTGTDLDSDGLCDNFDVDGDGDIDDTCVNVDNDVDENGLEICDHFDDCIDVDDDSICDNIDECIGFYDQCNVCNGNGTSCLVQSACDLPENTIFVYNNSEIWYNVDFDITSFIFMFEANLNSVYGGVASNENFVISYDNNSITGGGGTITSGCNILTYIDIEGEFDNFTDVTINFDAETVSYCDSCIYGEGGDSDDGGSDDGGSDDGGSDDGGTDGGGSFDACTLSNNSITIDDSGNVYYNVDFDIGGFQWAVDGATPNSCSGGDAETAGFTVSTGGSTILGFSFSGSFIPAGCGTLTQIDLTGEATGLSSIVFSNAGGFAVGVTYEEYEGASDEGSDDNNSDDGGSDGGGTDGGGSFDACTLSNNSITIDDSGNVYYNVDFDIGGFQWAVDGATPNSCSGGDAETAGFTVSTGGSTILGFSFSGSFIPAGCGTLTQIDLTGEATGLSSIVFSNADGFAVDVTYE